MIMSDDDTYPNEDLKKEAIEEFQKTRKFDGVTKDTHYSEKAWRSYKGKEEGDEDYNGDDDPTAMFIFQLQAFRDVGFKAYDSNGNDVASSVNISVTLTQMDGGHVFYSSKDNPQPLEITATGNNHLFKDIDKFSTETRILIRPDVYEMTYTFTDDVTNKPVTATRKLIVIAKRGDSEITIDDSVNNSDGTDIMKYAADSGTANSLYVYRIEDAEQTTDVSVNNSDGTYVMSHAADGIPQFYEALPTEELEEQKGD
jgi:hypothetical protein